MADMRKHCLHPFFSRSIFSSGRGFTLVEMMTTVVIAGVLATIAVTSYGKYVRRAVQTEAIAMLGEIRAKQEAYLAEAGTYLSTAADETTVTPAMAGYTLRAWGNHATPTPDAWGMLGVNPPRQQLYCGYVAMAGVFLAGPPNSFGTPAGGTDGAEVMNLIPRDADGNIPSPWFYARACCDIAAPYITGTCPHSPVGSGDVTVYTVSSFDNVIRERNVGQ